MGAARRHLEDHPDWVTRGCAQPGVDPDLFHAGAGEEAPARRARQAAARAVCARCPIVVACAAYAAGDGVTWWEPYGIWGGTTPGQRERARRDARRRVVGLPRWQSSSQRDALLKVLVGRRDLWAVRARLVAADARVLAGVGLDRRSVAWQVSRMCSMVGVDVRSATVGQVVVGAGRAGAVLPGGMGLVTAA